MSLPGSRGEGARPESALPSGNWGGALVRAAVILVASFVGFVLIPNRLVGYLSLHVVPKTRDGLVLLWVVAFFLFMCWLFVRLQRRGRV